MYVCMRVCMCVRMHICMYVCMYVCVCMYICMYAFMYVCMYVLGSCVVCQLTVPCKCHAQRVISGLSHDVDESRALLGYYAALNGKY